MILVYPFGKSVFLKAEVQFMVFLPICTQFCFEQDLYGMLLKMLAERGIDNHFAAWLRDYSTAMEQQHYIKFLEDLQGFVKLQ